MGKQVCKIESGLKIRILSYESGLKIGILSYENGLLSSTVTRLNSPMFSGHLVIHPCLLVI